MFNSKIILIEVLNPVSKWKISRLFNHIIRYQNWNINNDNVIDIDIDITSVSDINDDNIVDVKKDKDCGSDDINENNKRDKS